MSSATTPQAEATALGWAMRGEFGSATVRGVELLAGWHTPMLHVRSVEASIAFYALLGFELVGKMIVAGAATDQALG